MSDGDGSEQSKARLGIAAATIGAALLYAGVLWWASALGVRYSAYEEAENRCRGKAECSQPSLEQDIRSANAAELSADLGLAQVGLGVLSTLGLFGTIYYAHKAWKESEKAAKAAHDTLTHAEAISKAELRPWIEINIVPHAIEVSLIGSFSLRCDITCKNVGSTVARPVCIFYEYDLRADGFEDIADQCRKQWWTVKAENDKVILPGEVVTLPFSVHLHHSIVPWALLFENDHVWPRMTVGVFYKSDVDPEWKKAFRNFTIGRSTGPLGHFGISRDTGTMTPPELAAVSYGLSIAT